MKIHFAMCMALPLFLVGCGGGPSDQVDLAPIEGVVLLEGQPVKNAVLTFYPESGPTGVGKSDDEGKFLIKTNGVEGSPLGKCKVTVISSGSGTPEMDGNEGKIPEDEAINPKYASALTTDLVVDVPAEGNTDIKIELVK